MKKRLLNILFWSVISAAFIGPGTITTAAKAGASFGFALLWALVFSTLACLVLQEAAARISIISGKSLGRAIADKYRDKSWGWIVFVLVIGAIILGSAAYETGNLLGAAAGLTTIFSSDPRIWVILICLVAAAALLFPRLQVLARILGFLVVIMGFAFLFTAILLQPDFSSLIKGALLPSLPAGSSLLVLGLVGTTVVPYNLFLGSGIADKSQEIKEMRISLAMAIILGGVISMAVLVVGSSVEGEFTFDALGKALSFKLGSWAVWFFGIGLFAAGFSSAITAPLASALTAKDLFDNEKNHNWSGRGKYFILTWGFVLIAGLIFGTAGLKPIPAIIAAQALNGLILPFVSIFLWYSINDPGLMGTDKTNPGAANMLFAIVVWIVTLLGIQNVVHALLKIFHYETWDELTIILIILSFLSTSYFYYKTQKIK
jgi:Mn2+/Fe2+ NRAMP family transporter